MQSTDVPSRFPIPFANSAGGAYIRAIPTASQIGISDGAASLTDGFVPDNFTPVAGGGIPPSGRDFNGILYRATGWNRWHAAGAPIVYNGAFATAIGGYPKGALLQSSTVVGLFYVSTAENNTTNPEAGGANWRVVLPAKASLAQVQAGTDDTTYITPLKLAQIRASAADVHAGTDDVKYVTPAALRGAGTFVPGNPGYNVGANGFITQWGQVNTNANGNTTVFFPIAFPSACFVALCSGATPSAGVNQQDNDPAAVPGTITQASFGIWSSRDGPTAVSWVAYGN